MVGLSVRRLLWLCVIIWCFELDPPSLFQAVCDSKGLFVSIGKKNFYPNLLVNACTKQITMKMGSANVALGLGFELVGQGLLVGSIPKLDILACILPTHGLNHNDHHMPVTLVFPAQGRTLFHTSFIRLLNQRRAQFGTRSLWWVGVFLNTSGLIKK